MLQLLTSKYSARILLMLVVLGLALAIEPAAGADACAPWRANC